ncbi:MAG: IS1 family transposase [Desulfobacteraceae bacterium]|nr:IS1 family transposase [Desulfobacteraceae bacterium]MBC2754578.1 IS1 family transposase [Desulfobacteraceae bacterium]
MNKASIEKQTQIIHCLVEGNSIRATERITSTHRDTIMRLMVRVGNACQILSDEKLQQLNCKRIQVDEIWTYVKKKQRHMTSSDDPGQIGDMWTFVAIDADTKLIPAYKVGKRDIYTAQEFMNDLSGRLINRVQISSDALRAYVEATEQAFGTDVDYGQIVKSYEAEPVGPGRYSPPKVANTKKTTIKGDPDINHISTSYIERQNLTMRMSIRRFTRLTNAFSKKLENLKAAVSLHFSYYNFVRIHRTLRVTPAMEAGIESRIWNLSDLVEMAN